MSMRGWIPRRAAALAGAVAVLAVAGCGVGSDPSGGGDASGGESGGQVRNPDIFVHAQNGEPESLDPARVEQGEKGEQFVYNVYERLLDIGPDGPELIPAIATEVPSRANGLISDDGLTYTFPIREGVTFHDGSELNAAVVKFSWDRAMEMNLPEGQAAELVDTVEETRVVDDHTFEVTLKQPNAAFLNAAVVSPVASIVSQQAVEANGGVAEGEPSEYMDTSMVGTGPYKFERWQRGERLLMVVNEDYWGETAKVDVRWDITPDESARILQLKAGEADTVDISPSNISEVEGSDGIEISSDQLTLEPLHLGFNLRIPEGARPRGDDVPSDFFADVRVRQAFNHAFDHDTYINQFLEGFGARYTSYLPQGVLGYDESAPMYDYDPARAEQLLREAGWWDRGFSASILVQEGEPEFEGVALLMKDGLEQLNPNFRIRVVKQAETQFDENLGKDPVEFPMWVKNADPFADPHPFFDNYQHPEGQWGQIHGFAAGYANDERIAELIDQGVRETDADARRAIYAELQRLCYEDPMWVYAAQEGLAVAYRDWVTSFPVNPLWRGFQYRYVDKAG
jgi:peptide/nickel transport system substrate-binding protein